MNFQETKRRDFLRVMAAGATGILIGDSRIASANASTLLKIRKPFHGAVLNRNMGQEVKSGLKICVEGDAPLGDRVTVNGVPALRTGITFSAGR